MKNTTDRNLAFSLFQLLVILIVYLCFLKIDTSWSQDSGFLFKSLKIYQIIATALIIFLLYRLTNKIFTKILRVHSSKTKNISLSLLFSLLFIFLCLNYLVKSHFEIFLASRAFSMITQPGFFTTIELNVFHAFAAIGLIVALTIITYFIKKLFHISVINKYSKAFTITITLIIITEKIISSYFVHTANYETNQSIDNIPYYIRISIGKIWKALGIPKSKMIDADYHKKSFEYKQYSAHLKEATLPSKITAKNDHNIIIFVLESFRGDMVTDQIMPNTMSMVQNDGAIYNHHHYSIGNSTAESVFGALSGQTSFFWLQSKEERRYPRLYTILDNLGYNQNLYYTSKLNFRNIDSYVFDSKYLNIKNFIRGKNKNFKNRREFKTSRLEIDDIDAINNFVNTPTPKGKNLDIIYLYSAHYNYYYPKEFEKFKPTLPNDFGIKSVRLKLFRNELYNRYKNAAYFIDDLIGKVIKKLKREKIYDNTIIAIIGDHGEELLEFGKIGHSINLNEYQTRTPFILKTPARAKTRYKITSHADIVPTILNLLEVNFDTETFFSGKNLLKYDKDRDSAILLNCLRSGIPLQFALIQDQYKIFFDNQAQDVQVRYVTDLKDKVIRNFPAEKLRYYKSNIMARKNHFKKTHAKSL